VYDVTRHSSYGSVLGIEGHPPARAGGRGDGRPGDLGFGFGCVESGGECGLFRGD